MPSALSLRYCGTSFSIALAEALCREELFEKSPEEVDELIKQSPAFPVFSKGVWDIMCQILHPNPQLKYHPDPNSDGPVFEAKDDIWSPEFDKTVTRDLERYEAFLKNPTSSESKPESRSTGVLMADGTILDELSAIANLLPLAETYMSGFPGLHNAAKNIYLHRVTLTLLEQDGPRILSDMELSGLSFGLEYRLRMSSLATQYKNYLGIDYLDCDQIDCEVEQHDIDNMASAANKQRSYSIWDILRKHHTALFDESQFRQGWASHKIMTYIAVMFYSSGLDLTEIEGYIWRLRSWNSTVAKRSAWFGIFSKRGHDAYNELVEKTLRQRDDESLAEMLKDGDW